MKSFAEEADAKYMLMQNAFYRSCLVLWNYPKKG